MIWGVTSGLMSVSVEGLATEITENPRMRPECSLSHPLAGEGEGAAHAPVPHTGRVQPAHES